MRNLWVTGYGSIDRLVIRVVWVSSSDHFLLWVKASRS